MRVGLIGAGNMARALARGWGDPVLVSDGGSGRAGRLADELGGEAASTPEVAKRADLVVLCHKPKQLGAVAAEIAADAKAVVSVLGGVSLAELEAAYPGTPVLRLMPNTPVEVSKGVTCFCPGHLVTEPLEQEVVALFERVGLVVKLDESVMAAATAISGVGPAYLALVVEAQVDAAIRQGLTGSIAGRLAAATMGGTAELLLAHGLDTIAVRRQVTSPGGGTARGLAALERGGLRAAFQDAADALMGWSGK